MAHTTEVMEPTNRRERRALDKGRRKHPEAGLTVTTLGLDRRLALLTITHLDGGRRVSKVVLTMAAAQAIRDRAAERGHHVTVELVELAPVPAALRETALAQITEGAARAPRRRPAR